MSTLPGDDFYFTEQNDPAGLRITRLTLGTTVYCWLVHPPGVPADAPQFRQHKIRFVYGGMTDASVIHECDPITEPNPNFTTHPTLNFADKFPSTSNEVSAKAILDSYWQNNYMGSVEHDIKLKMPASAAPTCNANFVRASLLSGDIGSRINSLSRLGSSETKMLCFTNTMQLFARVTNAQGQYNATVAKASLGISEWNGNVTKTGTSEEYNIFSGMFTIEGDERIPSVTLTDSRGLSSTTNGMKICVRKWDRTSVSVSNITRGDNSVSFDISKIYMRSFNKADGTTINLEGLTIPSPGLVTPTLEVRYKASGSDSYTILSGVNISDDSVIIPGLNKQRAYDIRVILTDYIGDSTTYDFVVTSAQTDVHMRNAHIRFGGYINAEGNPLKEDPCFDCDWNAFFAKGIYIKDSNGDWYDIVPILQGLIPNE